MTVNHYGGLQGAAVVLTGAAGGLGRSLAHAFAEQGASLQLVDREASGLERARRELGLADDRVKTCAVDLAITAELPGVVDEALANFGHLDVLVNNAAIVDGVDFEQLEPERFDEVLATNLRAPLFLSKAAIPPMRLQGSGRIINVASTAARTGGAYPSVVAYAASKAGLLSVTRSLARLTARDNVLVNAILPANIEAPMLRDAFDASAVDTVLAGVPLRRAAAPLEVAELVLFLASTASSYITGASWDVNGGWFMA